MEFILSVFKFFTFSSGFVPLNKPGYEAINTQRDHYERMFREMAEVGDPLKSAMITEFTAFCYSHDFSQCPLFDAHVNWTKEQWKTYRALNPVPPRSLR